MLPAQKMRGTVTKPIRPTYPLVFILQQSVGALKSIGDRHQCPSVHICTRLVAVRGRVDVDVINGLTTPNAPNHTSVLWIESLCCSAVAAQMKPDVLGGNQPSKEIDATLCAVYIRQDLATCSSAFCILPQHTS